MTTADTGMASGAEPFALRPMGSADLEAGFALSQAVGWSYQPHDWQLCLELGRGWVACDTAGVVRATAMWWAWGDATATLGTIIVQPGLHGRGIGALLVERLMSESAPRARQLVATSAGLKLYARCGFAAVKDIAQHLGTVQPGEAPPLPAGCTLRPLESSDLEAAASLDALAFGGQRRELLAAILARGGGFALERAGRLVGYALMRPAGRGTTVGPVVADNPAAAMGLIAHCLDGPPRLLRLDIPAAQTTLARWLVARGLPCVDRVTLMRQGAWPGSHGTLQVFGLASQALG